MHWCEGEKTALLQTWVLARLSSLQMCCFVRGGGCFPKRPSGAKCVGKKIETLCSTARTGSIHFVILSCHFQVSPQCRRGDYAWC